MRLFKHKLTFKNVNVETWYEANKMLSLFGRLNPIWGLKQSLKQ